jgi:hypothetical protein
MPCKRPVRGKADDQQKFEAELKLCSKKISVLTNKQGIRKIPTENVHKVTTVVKITRREKFDQ